MGIWIIIAVIITAVVLSITCRSSMPEWAKAPCARCGSAVMRWLRGQNSHPKGEAKFCCKACGHKEYRGGNESELAMLDWEAGK